MICKEKFAVQREMFVIRCDKCCKRLVGDERTRMRIVTYHYVVGGTSRIEKQKYHLCEMCAFNQINDMEQRRERIVSGVTDAEQEALLHGLFAKKRR